MYAQKDSTFTPTDSSDINWMTWDNIEVAMAFKPKKIVVFIEIDTIPICVKMHATTLKDTVIEYILNNDVYAIKLDAISRDTIHFLNVMFEFNEESQYHDLASGILFNEMYFPSIVIFAENYQLLKTLKGFQTKQYFSNALMYYVDDRHLEASGPVQFGVRYQCKNPNHPHNKLRMQDQQRAQRENQNTPNK